MDDSRRTVLSQPDEGLAEFSALMEQVRLGSPQAAEQLWQKYGPYVVHVVRRSLHRRVRSQFDSQDFAQAAWASFFNHLPEARRFDTPGALVGFLSKLARNKVVTEHRRLHGTDRGVQLERRLDDSAAASEYIDARTPTPSQEAVADELVERLTAGQPPLYGRIVRMRREGFTAVEIAEREKTSTRTVRRVLTDLKKLLVKRWGGQRE
jgi:RNA polymerase sigma factor (sigma-70 family)